MESVRVVLHGFAGALFSAFVWGVVTWVTRGEWVNATNGDIALALAMVAFGRTVVRW